MLFFTLVSYILITSWPCFAKNLSSVDHLMQYKNKTSRSERLFLEKVIERYSNKVRLSLRQLCHRIDHFQRKRQCFNSAFSSHHSLFSFPRWNFPRKICYVLLEIRWTLTGSWIQWKWTFLLTIEDIPNDECFSISRMCWGSNQITFIGRKLDMSYTTMCKSKERENEFDVWLFSSVYRWICRNSLQPQRAIPCSWNEAKYVPLGDQTNLLSVHF